MTRTRSDIVTQTVSRGWIAALGGVVVGLYWLGNADSIPIAAAAPNVRSPDRITANDNRIPAGSLQNGVLTIRLEAREGEWHPDGDNDPGIVVHAFGEEGKPLQIPGPLLRVPKGAEISASIRNSLPDSTLFVRGFYTRGAAGGEIIQIKPGEVREVRFTAGAPGTYYYWASTSAALPIGVRGQDSQLSGAFIVDSSSTLGAPRDRIFVLGLWSTLAPGTVPGPSTILRFVMNGKAWPNTERLTYTVGDSVHFRIVNTSAAPHPMHLHGFYFSVDSRGDERADTAYGATSPRKAVTERAAPGRTFLLTWVPERPGNWMFHCHDNVHVARNRPFDGTPLPPEREHMAHAKNHALEMMGGLVMGIEVRPKGSATAAKSDDAPRRKLRLVARVDSGSTDSEPAFGYVLQDGRTTTPSQGPLLPGPTIVLERGKPVSITVVNELPEATAVHWHGIELESYFDGVAGFSGTSAKLSPAIAPRDSFEARFTPPRAGTFIYHPHADEVRQQRAGMSGAIVVLSPNERYDPQHDMVLLVSTPRRAADNATVFLNGTNTPAPREMRVGQRYRLRLVNIHTARASMIAQMMRDTTVLTWRAIAKDGMDLPNDLATVRRASQQSGNGEVYDFEFVPTEPGNIRFTMWTGNLATLLVSMPILVR
jgi:FtsP/CotA-like multicopper oxidase with cupredoxin domain